MKVPRGGHAYDIGRQKMGYPEWEMTDFWLPQCDQDAESLAWKFLGVIHECLSMEVVSE